LIKKQLYSRGPFFCNLLPSSGGEWKEEAHLLVCVRLISSPSIPTPPQIKMAKTQTPVAEDSMSSRADESAPAGTLIPAVELHRLVCSGF